MARTPFDADYGSGQGRINPTEPAPEGSYVFQLGHDRPGVVRGFVNGDSHTISQVVTFDPSVRALRSSATIRPASIPLPGGCAWMLVCSVDGVPYRTEDVSVGPPRVLRDIAYPAFSGGNSVEFSLNFTSHSGLVEVEIPGVAIDAIVEDTSPIPLGIINRSPEPGATQVLGTTTISFDLIDSEGDSADPALTTIYVAGAVVYSGGSFAAAWSTSSIANAGQPVTSFVLVPPASFVSEQVVTVRVVSTSAHAPVTSCDVTWSFIIVDTTPPVVVSATALDATHVLVRFSEPMAQRDPADEADTLNHGLYTLAILTGTPAVTPAVLAAAPGADPSLVVLALDDAMTAGTAYQVSVGAAQDAHGNALLLPATASCVWAGCPVPDGRDASLWKLLTQGVRTDDQRGSGDLAKFVSCLQVVFDELLCDVDRWTEILDPDVAPEPFVEAMLADLGNPFETFDLSATTKRKLVRLLVPLYRRKGTDRGIVDAIRLLVGVEVTISTPQWSGIWSMGESELGVDTLLGTSDLHTVYGFYITSPVILTAEQKAQIETIVGIMRRAPTHLLGILEPALPPPIPDHWELGLSQLGTQTLLH